MKNIAVKFTLFIIIIAFASCSTPRMFTTLETLHPAEVSFDPSVQRVLIVNNSVVQPDNVGHFDFKTFNEIEKPTNVSLKFDSAAVFCIASLKENLEETGFFRSVDMQLKSLNTSDVFNQTISLKPQNVKQLCREYGVDALIALNNIEIEDRLIKNRKNEPGALDVMVKTKWEVLYPNEKHGVAKEFVDEFSWEEYQAQELPARYDALVDASILSGVNISNRMIPQWEKEERYFFTPKRGLFTQAMHAFSQRNWKEAIQLWEQAEQEYSDASLKFYAVNNIAIVYEIMGDLDQAITYGDYLIKLYPHVKVYSTYSLDQINQSIQYVAKLKTKREEQKLLRKQLGE